MIRWPIRTIRDNLTGPAVLRLTKVQSCQSPMAVAEGYEEERDNPYWSDSDGHLYKVEQIHTMTLGEFLRDIESEGR